MKYKLQVSNQLYSWCKKELVFIFSSNFLEFIKISTEDEHYKLLGSTFLCKCF